MHRNRSRGVKMAGQYLWILLLVSLRISFVFCRNSSHEISSQEENAGSTDDRKVVLSSNSDIAIATSAQVAAIVGTVCVFVIIMCCIAYHCIRRCGQQKQYSGLILPNVNEHTAARVHETQQAVVIQHSPPPVEENQQHLSQLNHPMQQPKCQPMQQFPPHSQSMQQFPPQYQPMQQFPPHNQPMQQFSPHNSPMQQFSNHNSPMQQFSPQNPPMQQFSPQHSPMQQFQQSATTSQFQYSPSSQEFYNFPEPPPAYDGSLPPKY